MAYSAMVQDVVRDLRHRIAKIEGRLPERLEGGAGLVQGRSGQSAAAPLATGACRFDARLGGGLPATGLVEIHGAFSRDAGAVAGFAMALAGLAAEPRGLLIWIGTSEIFRETGFPHAPGLAERFGIPPERLVLAEGRKLADVLWIAEQAAGLSASAAIVLEVGARPRGLDLTATRRLHRRALAAGHLLLLLRQAGCAAPTAAPIRLVVGPAAAGTRQTLAGPLPGSIGPPAFHVAIDKYRLSAPVEFILEWNGETRAFKERDHVPAAKTAVALAAVPADGTDPAPAVREIVAFPHAAGSGAPGGQPSRRQYPAHRGARRAG